MKAKQTSFRHITLSDRANIEAGLKQNHSLAKIAKDLKKIGIFYFEGNREA